MVKAQRGESANVEFLCPLSLLKKEQKTEVVDTGSVSFNELLCGGFRLGEITEAYGAFSTGKSQLAFTLCVNLLKLNSKYKTLFIDTEDSFRSGRIVDIAKEKNISKSKALEAIKLVRAKSSQEQMEVLERLDMILSSEPNIKLIIVDSLIAHLRAEYTDRKQLPIRQKILANMLHRLKNAMDKYGVGVYITNQVATDPGALFGDPTVALGGNVLAHFSQTRLYFRKGKGTRKIVKLTDSSCLPEGETTFKIGLCGVCE